MSGLAPPDRGPIDEVRVVLRAMAPNGQDLALAAHTMELRERVVGSYTSPRLPAAERIETHSNAARGGSTIGLADPRVLELVVGAGVRSNAFGTSHGWFRDAMRDGIVAW